MLEWGTVVQERYLGDSHDFIKYALLRAIHRDLGLTVGVNWYLTEPEHVDRAGNNDGEKRHHLKGGEWRQWDADLLDLLRRFEDPNVRHIDRVAAWGVMPPDTLYFDKMVPVEGRANWHRQAMVALEGSDVVFIDPDNGFEVASMTKRKAPKYSLYAEAVDWFRAGKAVIGIQFARQCDPIRRAREVRDKLLDGLEEAAVLPVIRGRVAPNILFVTVAPDRLVDPLSAAVRAFAETGPKVELIE